MMRAVALMKHEVQGFRLIGLNRFSELEVRRGGGAGVAQDRPAFGLLLFAIDRRACREVLLLERRSGVHEL